MTQLKNLAGARANAAIELRHAGQLRRDLAAGRLPRGAALSAIRDCLRHARFSNALSRVIQSCLGAHA